MSRGRQPKELEENTERLINVLSLAAPGCVTYRMLEKSFNRKHDSIREYARNASNKGFIVEAYKLVGLRIRNPRILKE
jgi:hypothetical protein